MLVALLILLREGLEASIMIGIIAGYLRQTGRGQWLPAMWVGIGLACLLSVAVGVALQLAHAEFPQRQQELFEGVVGLVAVSFLTWMVLWMSRAAHTMKRELQRSVDQALQDNDRQGWALAGMAFLAAAREGLESAFFLIAATQQSSGWGTFVGGLLGLALAVLVAWGLFRGGMRLNLGRFFRYTGMLILFVAAGLLSGALRALHEAGLWNHLQATAFDLSHLLPVDSFAGALLAGLLGYHDAPTVGEMLAYLLYLVPALVLFLSAMAPRRQSAATAPTQA